MLSRSSYQSCFVKRGTLKISQFLKFHSKTPVLESLFYEVAGLKMFSCEICEIFKSTFFIHPVAASIDLLIVVSWEQNEKKIISATKYFSYVKTTKGVTWRPPTLLKETPIQVFSCESCKSFKCTIFEENLSTFAPGYHPFKQFFDNAQLIFYK